MDTNRGSTNISILVLSLLSGLIVILTSVFQWTLVDVLTPFLMPIIWFIVFAVFLITLIVSIIVLIRGKLWKPFSIHIIALIFYFFFPVTQTVINLDYRLNKEVRLEVIKLIESKALVPNVSYNDSIIHLPKEFKHLSKGGGDIMIEKEGKKVLFLTFRGVLDNFSGFIYSSDDQKPQQVDFGGDYKEIKRMGKNWFWASSY
ncbi:hypothetical protein M5X00_32275 [Paenibacillus alvei]|uniref:Uncharacterized protein n=1 Tax=Paenibacillus alvei TaxID=44250 RepID=A0ABT4GUX4_PAEAL|nr:hypothetical protein [Paenibacillus alvei]EJW17330.1 hypothetical protein PAV_4c04340 [Paenibacillus alvei DSM 29]MCY9544429.1 hypothetical protein [Paenibacillus alvei]MCY9705696.1 hypothetical protein [Paenibacillus alvei]MCY9734931.1 hypothetical protein [Paenibacillus alvei]MCY9758896.1 hypothetical protein [Paenibacillus alvei]